MIWPIHDGEQTPAPTMAALLSAKPFGANIYLELPGHRLPLRFTRVTDTGWKRTDGLARPNTWLGHDQLAELTTHGTITNPFTKESP